MDYNSNLILIDGDTRRRAAIVHALSPCNIHVEPLEAVSELSGTWPQSGVILIHDRDDAIGALIVKMADAGAWLPVVAFSEDPSAHQIVEAILEGALDYVVWPFDASGLTGTLQRAYERARQAGNVRLREAMARNRICRLTNRERQVLDGVANGLSNRLIGEKLSISPRTVEIHRANMLNKLGANHTSEAIRIAIEAALEN